MFEQIVYDKINSQFKKGGCPVNKIDVIRLKKRFSYGFIAKETQLSPTYIHLLAKGKRTNPSFDVMKRVSTVLGENVEKVFPAN